MNRLLFLLTYGIVSNLKISWRMRSSSVAESFWKHLESTEFHPQKQQKKKIK